MNDLPTSIVATGSKMAIQFHSLKPGIVIFYIYCFHDDVHTFSNPIILQVLNGVNGFRDF